MSSKILAIMVLAAVLFVWRMLAQTSSVDFIVENKIGVDLTFVSVTTGKSYLSFGTVGNGAAAGHLFFEGDIGTNAVIKFNGLSSTNQFSVSLIDVYSPERGGGRLLFLLHSNKADVAFGKRLTQ